MRCEFDPGKEQKNLQRHGLSLSLAEIVFDDSAAIEVEDFMDDNGEQRYQLLGLIDDVLLMVAYVYRDLDENGQEIPWVISVRKAVAYEENLYFKRHS